MKTRIILLASLTLIAAFIITIAPLPLITSAQAAEGSAFTGQFTGLNKHVTSGTVSILKTENGGSVLVLGKDFSLDGAPDPSVGLGKDGKYVHATNLGNMTRINGFQIYQIPDDLDWSVYNEVYIWCQKFTVPLGVASFE